MVNRCLALLVATAISLPAVADISAQDQVLVNEAKSLIQTFAGQLKPKLKQSLTEGGPVHAIEVCSKEAPAIAAGISADSGWQVRRVSLKARNAASATPDDWERQVLEQFDQWQQQGKKPQQLVYFSRQDKQFRFMKAQVVAPLCLTCHGTDINDEVAATLDQHYPEDVARGYSLGQVRGAFSLVKQLD